MDLSYKFPSTDSTERITYVPLQADLIPRFQRNQTDSPLMRLPAELRLKIWQHTLGGNRILPNKVIPGRERFHRWHSKIYLFAEPFENIRQFLSLLRVCRQIYHEARLFPFSCNIWEFWESVSYRTEYWNRWPRGLDPEQVNAIEWILVGGQRRVWARLRTEEMPRHELDWASIECLKGVKVIVRRLPLHEVDLERLDELAMRLNCKVIDEETAELTGVYSAVPRQAR